MLRLAPGDGPWLLAKIVGLVVYVGLGVVALRPGRSRAVRARGVARRARGGGVDRVGGVDEEPARLPRRMAPVVS
jgi:hypothetical protein